MFILYLFHYSKIILFKFNFILFKFHIERKDVVLHKQNINNLTRNKLIILKHIYISSKKMLLLQLSKRVLF